MSEWSPRSGVRLDRNSRAGTLAPSLRVIGIPYSYA